MAVYYKKQERCIPSGKGSIRKWYLTLKRTRLMHDMELAQALSDTTTLTLMESAVALHQLCEIVVREIRKGNTVQVGTLGSFRLTVKSGGVTEAAEVRPKIVKKIRLRFQPSKSLKKALSAVQFLPEKA